MNANVNSGLCYGENHDIRVLASPSFLESHKLLLRYTEQNAPLMSTLPKQKSSSSYFAGLKQNDFNFQILF